MIDSALEQLKIEDSESSSPCLVTPDAPVKAEGQPSLAVKIIRTDDDELVEISYNEYKLLRSIDHDHIVKMYDAFFNKTKQTMYLVMDLVQGKSLKQYLEQDKFSEELAKIIFRQILEVIDFLQTE